MRFPKPFFRASKDAWYVQLGKRQISLGKDREEAFERSRELLLHERGQNPEPAFRRLTVAQVFDLFLDWSGRHQALQETGCHPSEENKVGATNVALAAGLWVLPEHKTKKKTGKPRIVYLTPAMLELSRKLMERFPRGRSFGTAGASPGPGT